MMGTCLTHDARLTEPPLAGASSVVLTVLSVVRMIQVASWPAATITGGTTGLRFPDLAWAVWSVAAGVSVIVLLSLWILRRFVTALVILDVGVAILSLLVGGFLTLPVHGTDFHHPALAIAIGTALTVSLFWPFKRTLLVLAVLASAYLIGVHKTVVLGPRALTSAVANVLQLVGLPILVALVAHRVEELNRGRRHCLVELKSSRRLLAAQEVRESERLRQYRTLHDTVLSTLSVMSRGSLDTRHPEVQQRLTAEADYLRGLIATTGSTAGMQLVGELATLRREQAHVGLRIHPHIADVPDTLPATVVQAVGLCMREALNNVVKHSGTREAWVTIVGATEPGDPDLVVTVTDRGQGFDRRTTRIGVGLTQSIMARMSEAGGLAMVDSEPGQGTTVEMRWPR
ncbi:MAG: sensor histidine kinase [Arachnia sp.]